MSMNVKKIKLLIGNGADDITLYTDLPDPMVSCPNPDGAAFSCKATKGTAVKYVAEHFPDVPVEQVILTPHVNKFSKGG